MKRKIDVNIKSELAKRHACYVLITCDSPAKDGSMHVEMAYEGDPVLAAYLIEGAQSYLADIDMDQETKKIE